MNRTTTWVKNNDKKYNLNFISIKQNLPIRKAVNYQQSATKYLIENVAIFRKNDQNDSEFEIKVSQDKRK